MAPWNCLQRRPPPARWKKRSKEGSDTPTRAGEHRRPGRLRLILLAVLPLILTSSAATAFWGIAPYHPSQPPDQIRLSWSGDPHTSIGLNSFLLALNPFNFEAYLRRGRAYGRLGEAPKAIDDYSMFLSCVPKEDKRRAEVLFRRSNNYFVLGDSARAQADLQQLAELLKKESGVRTQKSQKK